MSLALYPSRVRSNDLLDASLLPHLRDEMLSRHETSETAVLWESSIVIQHEVLAFGYDNLIEGALGWHFASRDDNVRLKKRIAINNRHAIGD